ncbi:MAG: hypothetical protein L0332_12355 [Chloroflexi bacterium]|nr:hypothetical protein [Chloroflexota bacterium]MCI0574875.1 hypothetical protein [Chloroflexota bacterium]MCI0648377.1 hypothetical protein [Chloroflexota bacterium]MCI0727498.1 hypothetical protein [Chloroflexota bacterium]
MQDVPEILAVGCSMALFLGVIFGFFAFLRYMRYKETLALAERGLVRPGHVGNGNGRGTLRWGLVTFFLGLALCMGMWPIGFFVYSPGDGVPFGLGPWMLVGLLPMFFGLALLVLYALGRSESPPIIAPSASEEDAAPPSKYKGEE